MTQLIAAIGGIAAVAVLLALVIRFRPFRRDAAVSAVAETANLAEPGSLAVSLLPPAAFISAVERAIGQEVLLLRLRTPSGVFKVEVPGRSS